MYTVPIRQSLVFLPGNSLQAYGKLRTVLATLFLGVAGDEDRYAILISSVIFFPFKEKDKCEVYELP